MTISNNTRKFTIGVLVDSPCTDCKDRHEACHSKCSKYLEFKSKYEKIKNARIKNREYDRAGLSDGWNYSSRHKKNTG